MFLCQMGHMSERCVGDGCGFGQKHKRNNVPTAGLSREILFPSLELALAGACFWLGSVVAGRLC